MDIEIHIGLEAIAMICLVIVVLIGKYYKH